MGAKKIKGRKRHIVVDTMGNLISVVVHAANVHDTKAGISAAKLAFRDYPQIRGFCADAGYRGTFEREVEEKLNVSVDISERISGNKWEILPKRWIVERTFAWMNHSHGLSKDYEITRSSAESMIKIAHSHILLKRL